MDGIALVMIVRDEARSLERCLAAPARGSTRWWCSIPARVDATPEIARAARRAGRALRLDRRLRGGPQRRARPDRRALAAGSRRRRMDRPRRRLARRAARAGARLHRPDQRRQPVRRPAARVGEAPSWLPRVLPRGVALRAAASTSSRSRRCRDGACRSSSPTTAISMRSCAKKAGPQRAACSSSRSPPHPDDAYLRYQLGKDLEVRRPLRRGRAALPARPRRRRDPTPPGATTWSCAPSSRSRSPAASTTPLALAEAEAPRWPDSPDFFFALGDLLLDCAASAPARAAELLPRIESSWLRALEIGERPELADTVRGRGSFLAAHNLAVLHAGLGHDAEARRWREREAALRRAESGAALDAARLRPRPGRKRSRRTGARSPCISALRAAPAAYARLSISFCPRPTARRPDRRHADRPAPASCARRLGRARAGPPPLAGRPGAAGREQWAEAAQAFEQAATSAPTAPMRWRRSTP